MNRLRIDVPLPEVKAWIGLARTEREACTKEMRETALAFDDPVLERAAELLANVRPADEPPTYAGVHVVLDVEGEAIP